jgi:hypothetical protein
MHSSRMKMSVISDIRRSTTRRGRIRLSGGRIFSLMGTEVTSFQGWAKKGLMIHFRRGRALHLFAAIIMGHESQSINLTIFFVGPYFRQFIMVYHLYAPGKAGPF